MAAPYDSWWDNLNYFIECRRKKRTDRLKKVLEESGGHCKFWYITKDMETQYKDLKNSSDSILKAKLKYAVHIYHTFENNFGFREHDEWCVYDNNQNLKEGIIKLGETLHAICHPSLDLIQYRAVGLLLNNNKTDLNKIEESKSCSCNNTSNDLKCLQNENEITRNSRLILRREQFLRHYFEIISLRNILSEEIKLQEKQISTLKMWMGVFISIILAEISIFVSIEDIDTIVTLSLLGIPVILLIGAIWWYIWSSVKLNEAKDVMYICLGVDIDNPKLIPASE